MLRKSGKIIDISCCIAYKSINNVAEQYKEIQMIKRLFKNLFAVRSEQERLYNYLCQATDHVHLEVLQRDWDRMSHRDRSMW
jgi:hypothetical protein